MFRIRRKSSISHPGSDHGPGRPDSHSQGAMDPVVLTSQRGIWATKVSFVALLATAAIQVAVFLITGSVALLADTIHNFGAATTAIPLWFAFTLSKRSPTSRFIYGYGRTEDLAGLFIVLVIFASGILAGYESATRLFDPPEVEFLWAVALAAGIGFLGNEWVALLRIRVGKEIGSAALVADGYHARVDGLTSLAVLFGTLGIWLGYPIADPIAGMVITLAILQIVVQSGKTVFARLLDGVEPEVIEEVRHGAAETTGVQEVSDVRVRWLGHRLLAEINIAVNPELSVAKGHDIAQEVHHQLLQRLRYLSNVTIHVDPVGESGEEHHISAAANGSNEEEAPTQT